MNLLSTEDKFNIKELELNALLEITQAINSNFSEESLYKIYEFTLRASLEVRKVALYVWEEKWQLKVKYGISDIPAIDYDKLTSFDEPVKLDYMGLSGLHPVFDIFIPVKHKKKTLAFVLIDKKLQDEEKINTNFIQALTNIIVVAIENKKLARRQLAEEALLKEIEIAKRVQHLLFPKDLPWSDNLKVQATYLPHHEVGGDYYDFIELNDDEFIACIADVSGKGIPAAILMSNFQAALRTLSRKVRDLKEIVRELNHQILQNANGENFITLFLARYSRSRKALTYISAGHNSVLLKKLGKISQLESTTTVLGAFETLPFVDKMEISELENFMLLLYTDGITEAMNKEREQFELERLENLLGATENNDAHERILQKVADWQGESPQHDDITLMSIHVNNN